MRLFKLVAILPLLSPGIGYSAGFQLFEQSASAFSVAGTNQAEAKDASAVFWNPASLTLLEDGSTTGALQLYLPVGQLHNIQATSAISNAPTGGNNGGSPGSLTPAASAFFSKKISETASLGLSLTSPFGLGARYDEGWQGRYHALESSLVTVDLGLAGAYRVTPTLSFGAGLDIQYARAKFASAIDLSTACLGTAASIPGVFSQCLANGYATPGNVNTDGKSTVTGDSWAPGWNVGLMWNLSPDLRLGLAYRSKVTHKLEGEATIIKPSTLPIAVASLAPLSNTGVESKLVIPASASISAFYHATDKIDLMASATWVRWSSLQEIRTHYDNGAPDTVINLQWRDTWRIGGGASIRIAPTVTLRAGLAFDQSPTTSISRQTLFVPDGDRWIGGLGATIALTNKSSLDIGYIVYKYDPVQIASSAPAAGLFQGAFTHSYLHGLSVQYNMRL